MGLQTEGKEAGAALPWRTQVPAAPGVSSAAGRPWGRQGLQGQAHRQEARLSCRSMGVGAEIKGKAESSAKRRTKVPSVLYGRPDRQTDRGPGMELWQPPGFSHATGTIPGPSLQGKAAPHTGEDWRWLVCPHGLCQHQAAVAAGISSGCKTQYWGQTCNLIAKEPCTDTCFHRGGASSAPGTPPAQQPYC